MNPVKKIWFDENTMPPKNMIWYKGEGKFYEYKNGEWIVAYDLNSMPTQEEQEELVAAIQEKNPDFVVDEDKSLLPQILSEILKLATAQPPAPTDMVKVLVIPNYSGIDIEADSKAEFCEAAGITEEQLDSLLSGDYAFVKCPNRGDLEKVFLTPLYPGGDKIWFKMIDVNDIDSPNNIIVLTFQIYNGRYLLLEY